MVCPVFVVTQEVILIPIVQGGGEEQLGNPEMAHFLKAAVGGVEAAACDPEFIARDLLAKFDECATRHTHYPRYSMAAKTNEPKINQALMCGGCAATYTNSHTTRNDGSHFIR